jgi:hypothetical protein
MTEIQYFEQFVGDPPPQRVHLTDEQARLLSEGLLSIANEDWEAYRRGEIIIVWPDGREYRYGDN